jgi:hypothetical protein
LSTGTAAPPYQYDGMLRIAADPFTFKGIIPLIGKSLYGKNVA